MEGSEFLTDYMRDYTEEYILIGGNACALNFRNIEAEFRATVDLDIVLITESTNDAFYAHFWEYIREHGYEGKVFRGSNTGGCSYRFTLPEEKREPGLPVQIELFSRKPEYFDSKLSEPGREHITLLEAGDKISNLSAILLDDEVYDFIRSSKITLENISTVNMECLFGLKSVAWHSNQKLFDEKKIADINTVLKHPQDMISIVNVMDELRETEFPPQVYQSIVVSRKELSEDEFRAKIPSEDAAIDTTIEYIDEFVREQAS
ncbi:hypothetical protein ACCY16_17145 [Candidatus Pantoea formicae]|uniref:hypothetical protein n=1 Tax=Candidatus Pantoea formicae TaxID=2608355 RepID=UPI003ED8D493